jgi:colanic acid biosynthesis glycosyl transferase WcaI
VLSSDLGDNVAAKMWPARRSDVAVIPNFVDTEFIRPIDRITPFRGELGIGDEIVVLYAGNVGFSQSLEMVVDAARDLPALTFVINGDGAARAELQAGAAGLGNIRFTGYQPKQRLPEVLATGDIHLVPLKAGLGRVSVPSKTYSILAAGRPVLAAIDAGTEVPRILAASGGGIAIAPDDPSALRSALRQMADDSEGRRAMAAAGRRWVEQAASPRAVAQKYAELIVELNRRR